MATIYTKDALEIVTTIHVDYNVDRKYEDVDLSHLFSLPLYFRSSALIRIIDIAFIQDVSEHDYTVDQHYAGNFAQQLQFRRHFILMWSNHGH